MEPADPDEHSARLELARLESAVSRYRDEPGRLSALLTDVLNDEALFGVVAEQSRFHTNGFAKVVLDEGEAGRLRLHVWPPDWRRTSSHPHGHRWPFASWVVFGELREAVLVEDEQGELFHVYDYLGTDATMPDEPTRTVRLAPLALEPRRAGTVYARRTGELHVAAPATDDLVATLVLQGATTTMSTPVYRSPGAPPPQHGEPIPPEQVRSLLADVNRLLLAHHSGAVWSAASRLADAERARRG